MNRRSFVQGGSSALALAAEFAFPGAALAQPLSEAPARSVPFSQDWLLGEAVRLAAEPFEAASTDLPAGLGDMGYDQYRAISFRPEARIWEGEPTRFQVDLLHRGFIYKAPVRISVVEGERATPIRFSPALFEYGPNVQAPPHDEELEFSGFRIRGLANTLDYWGEFLVFQGASYFRAIGRDQLYGLSARGLAVNTALPQGEEFPAFRQFWIERPTPDQTTLVVHALLDSPSVTGAYRFAVTPGVETVVEVDAAIVPRAGVEKLGIAPLTSMFMFNGSNRGVFDDFRPAVHDSDGLQMLTGAGEWIWRPLANPRELQISAFADVRPRGFGLMQRARRSEDFEDLEARYEQRPSVWIEPIGVWEAGCVELIEIPTEAEIHDNIVAYWRPDTAVPAGAPWRFGYRMRWTDEVRPLHGMLVTRSSRMGRSPDGKRRLFVIDFAAADRSVPREITVEASASTGVISQPIVRPRRPEGAVRVSFELEPASDEPSELRLRLLGSNGPASETWLYRWTSR